MSFFFSSKSGRRGTPRHRRLALLFPPLLAVLLACTAGSSSAGVAAGQSSIVAGAKLSGTVTWRVRASGPVAAVEFWADNHRLGRDTKAPFVFPLDTRRLGNGTHALGLAVVRPDGARLTPQVGQVTVRNTAARVTSHRSSIRAGTRLSGTVMWRVQAPGRVAAVEFWADNRRLGRDTKAPFVFPLDTRRLGNGTHALGWAVVRPDGKRVTPQVGEVIVRNAVAKAQAKKHTKKSRLAPRLTGRTGAITFRGDWETGNRAQWSSFECPNLSSQFRLERSIVRQGRYAARFQISPGDVWGGNNTIRCLAGAYYTNETVGDDYYFGFSVYVPSGYFDDNLIWELHHPESLYNVDECGVAPFALHAEGPALMFRIATGDCTPGEGYSYWRPNVAIRGLGQYPRDRWIDFIVHIRFTESRTGLVELWHRAGDGSWPSRPQLRVSGVPTMPYCDACGVRNVHLYTEMGLYTGGGSTGGTSVVYLDGYRRGTTLGAVLAGFPR